VFQEQGIKFGVSGTQETLSVDQEQAAVFGVSGTEIRGFENGLSVL